MNLALFAAKRCGHECTIIGTSGRHPTCTLKPGHEGRHFDRRKKTRWDTPVDGMWPTVTAG